MVSFYHKYLHPDGTDLQNWSVETRDAGTVFYCDYCKALSPVHLRRYLLFSLFVFRCQNLNMYTCSKIDLVTNFLLGLFQRDFKTNSQV